MSAPARLWLKRVGWLVLIWSASVLALAFGLGNRDLAGEIMREWYDRYRAEREAHERATQSAALADDLDVEPTLQPGEKLERMSRPGDRRR